jgi:hypothetical protein
MVRTGAFEWQQKHQQQQKLNNANDKDNEEEEVPEEGEIDADRDSALIDSIEWNGR